MKLNIIKVLNQIDAEEATVINLIDPEASWNKRASDDYRDMYEYDKFMTEMVNSQTIEAIEYFENLVVEHNLTVDPILSYEEWLDEEMAKCSNYMIAA